jgi:hypothetical protein
MRAERSNPFGILHLSATLYFLLATLGMRQLLCCYHVRNRFVAELQIFLNCDVVLNLEPDHRGSKHESSAQEAPL